MNNTITNSFIPIHFVGDSADVYTDKTTGEILLRHETDLSSGVDIRSTVDVVIEPGSYVKVPTGIQLSIAPGCEAQVRPRSGLAFKHGVTVLNAPGTIDADYRGEVCVLLINHGTESYTVTRGDRIAQIVVGFHHRCNFYVDPDVFGIDDTTGRGHGGFGSTGK